MKKGHREEQGSAKKGKATHSDPVPHRQGTRERVFMGLSFLIAVLAVFLSSRDTGVAPTMLSSLAILIVYIALVALLSFILKRADPVEGRRRLLLWLGALGTAGLLTLLLSPAVSGFLSPSGTVPSTVSPDGFRVYEDPVLGFRIAYPGDWTPVRKKDQGSELVTNTAFLSRDGKTVATVQVTDLSAPGYLGAPLDVWVNRSIGVLASNAISSQFRILRNERTVFAGYPAQVLDYTVVLNSGERIRTVGYLLEVGSKGYNVGFTTREDLF
ncbi:MAG TPA: hypothetical protein VK450_05565, partial [Methanomicrobiales archaeon]|nr:hypothetical protein [Methanomicrobiales archaeon]